MKFTVDKDNYYNTFNRLQTLLTDYDILMLDLYKRTAPEHGDFLEVITMIKDLKETKRTIKGMIAMISVKLCSEDK